MFDDRREPSCRFPRSGLPKINKKEGRMHGDPSAPCTVRPFALNAFDYYCVSVGAAHNFLPFSFQAICSR
jgi:hypothetical protein